MPDEAQSPATDLGADAQLAAPVAPGAEDRRDHPTLPSKPAWVQFLATALRLCDAHDSDRTVGAVYASVPDEARRGASGGRFVSIGWALLEYLRDRELAGAHDYVSLAGFIGETAQTNGVSKEDVQYVIILLSTPTKLSFVETADGETRRRATTDTALIDKQRRGYACRLSTAGREALGFASGYFKWVHAGVEARKLIVDLQGGDFRSFYQVAIRILDRIRTESLEVRRACERPEVEDLRQYFLDHAERFTGTIHEVMNVVGDVQRLIGTNEVLDALDRWSETIRDDDAISATLCNELIQDILNALRQLQKLFSKFVQDVQRRDRALVGIVRFDAMARRFVGSPADWRTDPAFLERLFGGVGPLLPDAPAFTPTELRHSVEPPRPKEYARQGFRRIGDPLQVKDRIELFVDRNRERILARLRKGPLTLTEMLQDEDFLNPVDLENLAEICSLIISPLILRFDDVDGTRIRIQLGDPHIWQLPDGWEISGTEFAMTLEEASGGL